MNMAPPPELLVFISVALAPELSFYGSGSNFCLFSHINILIILVCLKLNGKRIKSSYTKLKYTKPFSVI